ncbi:MAG: hypothetical protein QM756_18755 [Polyangiaceae bacterium]
MTSAARALALVGATLAAACGKARTDPIGGATASRSASAPASVTASAPAPAPPPIAPDMPQLIQAPCRVLRVSGSARVVAGMELSNLTGLDGKAWLELAAKAEVSVRHGATSREFSLHGPGRFLPCRQGLEQVLVAEGAFESSAGSGVRPGAEMWVSTPFGTVRYADADARLRVEAGGLRLSAASGRVVVEGSDGKLLTLTAPVPERRLGSALPATESVTRCEASARTAEQSAARVLAPGGDDLGKLAATQLESRRRARAQCLVAEASVERLAEGPEKARLRDQVSQANQLWQAVPAMLR